MGQLYSEITPEIAKWVAAQKVFFVASAPLAGSGHVNCSPKGLDTLRITGPTTVAYLDLTGSGSETIAHLRENGRIVLMFCAFEGPPKIVRFHGRGEVIAPTSPKWNANRALFPDQPGDRSIIVVNISRVSDSCGYGVPKLAFVEERDTIARWVQKRGEGNLPAYRRQKNARSIDGLPGADFDV